MDESWIKQYWRPLMAYQYAAVCLCDFIVFPSLSMALMNAPWDPLTLKESGFYHLAMSAIIGVAAWTRGQEKVKRILNGEEIEKITHSESQTPTGK